MDAELKVELEKLGALPEEMYELPEGTEVHRSPRSLPHYISTRLDRMEANASAMHSMETGGKAGSAEYERLESAVRQNLDELKPYRSGNLWAFSQRMWDEGESFDPSNKPAVTGVIGANRDPWHYKGEKHHRPSSVDPFD